MNRAITWEGFHNARDLGGLPTVSGGITRYGRLIRSADTRFITAAGWEAARAAGVRAVIDLRNPDEATPGARPSATLATGSLAVAAALATVAPPPDIETRLVPLDGIEDLALWQRLNSEGLNGTPLYYRPFLEAKPERVAAVLTAIAQAGDGGVIFHCTVGRDRTGLISLLLLSLADVTPEAIAADYELTLGQLTALDAALGIQREHRDVHAFLRSRGTTLAETITGLVRDLDVPAYLADAGMRRDDIDTLRRRLL